MDREPGLTKIGLISRYDRISSHLHGRLMEDGVFEVGKIRLQSVLQNGTIDGSDFEESQELADLGKGFSGPEGLSAR